MKIIKNKDFEKMENDVPFRPENKTNQSSELFVLLKSYFFSVVEEYLCFHLKLE